MVDIKFMPRLIWYEKIGKPLPDYKYTKVAIPVLIKLIST